MDMQHKSIESLGSIKSKLLRIDWLGQAVASLCWICSMFSYGINSIGDWLQLIAGLAWFIATIADINES